MFKCNAFPLLDSYEKARAHFENVEPMMRGDYKGVKPIHLRSRPIDRIMRDGDDVVYISIYGTNHSESEMRGMLDTQTAVRWKPNGEIHLRPPLYNCIYEQLYSLLGLNFYRQDNALWVQTHQTFRLRDHKWGERATADNTNIFKRDTTGYLQLMNPERRTRLLVNRKRANNVRSRYKEFRDYLCMMLKLREGVFSLQEAVDTLGLKDGAQEPRWHTLAGNNHIQIKYQYRYHYHSDRKGADLPEFMALIGSGDPEKFYRASLMMVRAYGEREYQTGRVATLTESVAIKALDEMLLYVHRDEVFDEQVLEAFDTAKDIYKWVRD